MFKGWSSHRNVHINRIIHCLHICKCMPEGSIKVQVTDAHVLQDFHLHLHASRRPYHASLPSVSSPGFFSYKKQGMRSGHLWEWQNELTFSLSGAFAFVKDFENSSIFHHKNQKCAWTPNSKSSRSRNPINLGSRRCIQSGLPCFKPCLLTPS